MENNKIAQYNKLCSQVAFNKQEAIRTIIQELELDYLSGRNPANTGYELTHPRYLKICFLGAREGHPMFNILKEALHEIGIEFSIFDLFYMFIAAKYWRYLGSTEKNEFFTQLIESPDFEQLSEFPYTLEIEEMLKGLNFSYLKTISAYGQRNGTIKIQCFFHGTIECRQVNAEDQYHYRDKKWITYSEEFNGINLSALTPISDDLPCNPNAWLYLLYWDNYPGSKRSVQFIL